MDIGSIGPRIDIELLQAAGDGTTRGHGTGASESSAPDTAVITAAAGGAESGAGVEGPAGLRSPNAAGKKDSPAELNKAAEEFESLLLAQILRSVRESGSGGWLGSGEGNQMTSTMELAETQLARAMAQSGALGITKMLTRDASADSKRGTAGQGTLAAAAAPPKSNGAE